MHTPVLLQETIRGLELSRWEGGTVIDGTVNNGGHSQEILKNYPNLSIVGFDLDLDAIKRSQTNLKEFKDRVQLIHASYEAIPEQIEKLQQEGKIKEIVGVIFDFGLSSDQLEISGRGFSFKKDEPLDMRFAASDNFNPITARIIVNEWKEDTLVAIISSFGEERYAKRIAAAIVAKREEKPITTTLELEEIIYTAVPTVYRKGKIHPATRTFQALRIAVNRELEAVEKGLKGAWGVLSTKGRIAAISFHSLEDRIVKRYFQEIGKNKEGLVITKRPLEAQEEETRSNPRSRSAKLRIIEKGEKSEEIIN